MRVVFVSMPFAGVRPAIGVSLLQARLRADGIESSTVYANMRFARRIGVAGYDYIAERAPTTMRRSEPCTWFSMIWSVGGSMKSRLPPSK